MNYLLSPQNVALLSTLIVLALASERLLVHLRPSGVLPWVIHAFVFLGRLAMVVLVLTLLLAMLPVSLHGAIPYAVIAMGVALGWSTRELLRDLASGVVIILEGRVQPGMRIESGNHRGVVQRLGFRAVYITSADGGVTSIPNREVTSSPFELDPISNPPIALKLHVPDDLSPRFVREELTTMALLSPHVAPEYPPQIVQDPVNRGLWEVRCRLTSLSYEGRFRGTMEKMIEARLSEFAERGELG